MYEVQTRSVQYGLVWTGRWRFVWPHALIRGAVGVKLAFERVVDSCIFAVAAHSTPK